jgi:demethylmenaquinone methyltransferase/2-methoxy-6-polyprenyl-1,4-benzoquinol methylase
VILEITNPTRPPLSTFYRVWFDHVVPVLGKVAGDSEAYEYLPNSVKRFPGPDGLAAEMDRAGLRDIRWILTAGGIIAIHVGTAA